MDIPKEIQVKLLSSPELIHELEKEAQKNPTQLKIISTGREKDPTFLEFDIAEVATIVTVVQGAFYLGQLSLQLYQLLKSNKAKRVVLQTPLRRVEITATTDLTEDQVRDILKYAVKIAS